MRALLKLVTFAIVVAVGTWFAFPPFREVPQVQQVHALVEPWLAKGLAALGVGKGGDPGGATKTADAKGGEAKGAGQKKGGGAAAPVTAAVASEGDMAVLLSAPGAVEPMASVVIKPRVDGQIIEVAFKEGDLVKEGQVLFRFDDRLVKAQMKQAEANLAQNRANLKDAEAILGRREALVAKKIVTEAATETQRMSVEALKAAIGAGQAQLDMQKTQLDYLIIKSPITGRTGSLTAKLGANVRAADPLGLVTVNQIQPVAVTFALPQAELPTIKRALERGSLAQITIGGDKPVKVSGKIFFVDNQVDKTTGTITAKVMAENSDELLWPGQSVEVELTAEVRSKIVSVPAPAVLPSQEGMMSWVIGPDSKVTPRAVTLDRIVGDRAYVTAGLKPGEQVVTDGQLRLAPGMTVAVREPPKAAPAAATEPSAKSDAPPKKGGAKSEPKTPGAETGPPASARSTGNGASSGRS